MTDQGQPLSRRDRRAMEQQADGQGAGTETGEIPTHGPDGQPLSRRDRRRLERSEKPMEIWTAEEEQIATGQMPAMTPEVIAEQEQLAREKARIAAEEALAASAELRGVAPASVNRDRIDEIEGIEAPPSSQSGGVPAIPPATDLPDWMNDIATDAARGGADSGGAPAVASPFNRPSDATPTAGLPNFGTAPAPDVDAPAGFPASSENTAPFNDAVPINDTVPSENTVPLNDAVPINDTAPSENTVPTDNPAQQATDPSEIPEAFRHMFPAGSLQARAMNERAAAAQSAHDEGQGTPEVGSSDPADEIRRLTAAAMAGIEGSSGSRDPEQVSSSPYDTPAAPAPDQPDFYSNLDGQGGQQEPTAAEQSQAPVIDGSPIDAELDAPAPGAFAGFGMGGETPPAEPTAFPPFDETQGDAPAPAFEGMPTFALEADVDEPPFEQLMGLDQPAPQPDFPQPDLSQPDVPQPRSAPTPGTGTPAFESPALGTPGLGTPGFGTPGLGTPGFGTPAFDTPGAGTPGAGVPGAFGPQSGQFPVTTGSIEVQRRAVPDLDAAGGARDFRWAHLLVIGAIAFALGVVVWHLAGVAQ